MGLCWPQAGHQLTSCPTRPSCPRSFPRCVHCVTCLKLPRMAVLCASALGEGGPRCKEIQCWVAWFWPSVLMCMAQILLLCATGPICNSLRRSLELGHGPQPWTSLGSLGTRLLPPEVPLHPVPRAVSASPSLASRTSQIAYELPAVCEGHYSKPVPRGSVDTDELKAGSGKGVRGSESHPLHSHRRLCLCQCDTRPPGHQRCSCICAGDPVMRPLVPP